MIDKPMSDRPTVSELRKAALEYFMLTLPAIHCSPGICRTCRDWIEREYRKLADRVEEAERQAKQWADATEFQGLRAEKAERELERTREAAIKLLESWRAGDDIEQKETYTMLRALRGGD